MDMEQTFRFRIGDEEDRLLRYLARLQRRSRSDVVRWAIRQAAFDALMNELIVRDLEERQFVKQAAAELKAAMTPPGIPDLEAGDERTPPRSQRAGGSHERQ